MIATVVISSVLLGLTVEVDQQDLPQMSGDLVAVQADQVLVNLGDTPTKLDPRGITRVSATANRDSTAASPLSIKLRDGSRLACSSLSSSGDMVLCNLAETAIEFSRDVVEQAQLLPVPDGTEKDWQQLLDAEHSADVVVVSTRSGIRGVEGVIGTIDDTLVKFQFDGEWIDVRREKVIGLIWYSGAARKLQPAVCRMTTTNGSRIEVHQLQVVRDETTDVEQVQVATAAGARLLLPAELTLRLDFASANLIYLSDLKPERVEQTEFLFFEFPQLAPYDQQLFGLRRDATVANQPLETDEQSRVTVHEKGVSVHSDAKIVYRLAGEYRRFVATASLDQVVSGVVQVDLIIRIDGREVARHAMRSDGESQPIDLNLTGANRIEFEVLRGPDSNVGDHLSLCDARLMK